MRFWQALTWVEPDQLLDAARFAEEVGFDGCMLADHGVFPRDVRSAYPYATDGAPPMDPDAPYPDCWATLGALVTATKRLRYTISVYVLPLRNVFEVARAAGTVAILSGNRVALGAGIGWMKEEFDIYGIDFKTRGKRCDEMIEVLLELLEPLRCRAVAARLRGNGHGLAAMAFEQPFRLEQAVGARNRHRIDRVRQRQVAYRRQRRPGLQLPARHHAPDRPVGTEQMILPDDLGESLRAQNVGERPRRLRFKKRVHRRLIWAECD